MRFIIDRSKWKCGGSMNPINKNTHGKGATYLLNDQGYMCCLGHVCRQLGVAVKDMEGIDIPSRINQSIPILTRKCDGTYQDTILANRAIKINDDHDTTLQKKESLLKKLFKQFGHTVVFEGKYEIKGLQ